MEQVQRPRLAARAGAAHRQNNAAVLSQRTDPLAKAAGDAPASGANTTVSGPLPVLEHPGNRPRFARRTPRAAGHYRGKQERRHSQPDCDSLLPRLRLPVRADRVTAGLRGCLGASVRSLHTALRRRERRMDTGVGVNVLVGSKNYDWCALLALAHLPLIFIQI